VRLLTFALVSLVLSYIDYSLGLELVRQIYGDFVAQLMSTPPVGLIYFATIYLVEFLLIVSIHRGLSLLWNRLIRRLKI
jgi:hypothetical protein